MFGELTHAFHLSQGQVDTYSKEMALVKGPWKDLNVFPFFPASGIPIFVP